MPGPCKRTRARNSFQGYRNPTTWADSFAFPGALAESWTRSRNQDTKWLSSMGCDFANKSSTLHHIAANFLNSKQTPIAASELLPYLLHSSYFQLFKMLLALSFPDFKRQKGKRLGGITVKRLGFKEERGKMFFPLQLRFLIP